MFNRLNTMPFSALRPNAIDNDPRKVLDEQPAARSADIDHHVEQYFTALSDGDDYGVRASLRGMIDATRSFYNAGGVPVYAHVPLPSHFVEELANDIDNLPDRHQPLAVSQFIEKLDPSVRTLAGQQLGEQVRDRQSRRAPAPTPMSDAMREGDLEQARTLEFREGDRQRYQWMQQARPAEQENPFDQRVRDPDKRQPPRVPLWEKVTPSKDQPGQFDFHMKPGHEGWKVCLGSKCRIYLPEEPIDITSNRGKSGQPGVYSMTPLYMY